MSFIIWTNELLEEGIDLGDPIRILSAFKQMAEVASGPEEREAYADLFGVPLAGEQEVSQEWLEDVKKQAATFWQKYGGKLGPDATWVVGVLAGLKQTDARD